jgi:hypothetical protein
VTPENPESFVSLATFISKNIGNRARDSLEMSLRLCPFIIETTVGPLPTLCCIAPVSIGGNYYSVNVRFTELRHEEKISG